MIFTGLNLIIPLFLILVGALGVTAVSLYTAKSLCRYRGLPYREAEWRWLVSFLILLGSALWWLNDWNLKALTFSQWFAEKGLWFGVVLIFIVIGGALAEIDQQLKVLPDELTGALLWIGLLVALLGVFQVSVEEALWGVIVGFLLGELIYRVSSWHYRQIVFGRGDIKFIAAIGAWVGAELMMPLLFLSSFSGALWGVTRSGAHQKRWKVTIPFGPHLFGSGIILILWGDNLMEFLGFK